jgi:hypothetical protein
MRTQQAHVHHYVPQWYQKRFLKSGQTKFYYLDLHPETISNNHGGYQRRTLLHWGPARCFYKEDLYMLKLPNWSTDQIEKRFFGSIDSRGRSAVEFFGKYDGYRDGVHEAFKMLPRYMDAQRFRTPRGLDWLQLISNLKDQNSTLIVLQAAYRFHTTMWVEGEWEIIRAQQSPTKFIVTDTPVTFFNPKVFPGSKECRYPGDVGLDKIGTRTLFPLGIDSCLLITHTQLVRNPWANPLHSRINARSYQETIKNLTDTQFGRELEEDEVFRINLILKKRATRYIAAADEEWLYPEKRASTTLWSKLDDDWFTLPHLWKVPFTTGYVVGNKDGSKWAMDEYGRNPDHPQYDQRAEREWDLHNRAQRAWARKRAGRSVAHIDDTMNSDRVGDELMREYLASTRTKTRDRC